ncbi:MAG TPA: extracellular solute-binding protein [Terriglobia bacterium]|nr:extracellular solute-binding protein [Terriglobia bacterium]
MQSKTFARPLAGLTAASPFAQDLPLLGAELRQQAAALSGEDRRHFLRRLAAAGLAPFLGTGLGIGVGTGLGLGLGQKARAADADELTFAVWGNSDIDHLSQAFGKPFKRDNNIDVVFDGTGPSEGKIKSMVDSGNVDWDICDTDGYACIRLGQSGALSAVDYSVVDRSQVIQPFAYDFGVAGYTYSFVLAYNANVYKDNPPQSWADFWNLRKYPGKRGLWKWMIGGFEAAAMAHGAKPGQLYPLDIADCVNRIGQLKPHLVTWETGNEAKQMMLDKVVTMACIWHTRAAQLAVETKGGIGWSFDQGLLCPGVWVVPKNNPGGNTVFKFLASMQEPSRQIALSSLRGVGPANPRASAAMPASLRSGDPTQPEALAQQSIVDSAWWATNYDKSMAKFTQMLTQS